VNITFEDDGFMYSYPAVKDTSFITWNNTGNCTYEASEFAFDDRCSSYYNDTKYSTESEFSRDEINSKNIIGSYIDQPFYTKVGADLRQVICQKDQVDSDNITMILCNQMNLHHMNVSYVESLDRITDADPGYFFVVFPDSLSTIFHPNINLTTVTLSPISDIELNSSYATPTSAELIGAFNFSTLETSSVLVVTPLDSSTTSTAIGLSPSTVNVNENVAYNKISFTNSS